MPPTSSPRGSRAASRRKSADDHRLHGAGVRGARVVDGRIVEREVPVLNALNELLRDDYIEDCQRGVDRWNRVIEKAGIPFRLAVPHRAFHREIGTFADARVSPDGRVVSEAEWDAHGANWLPTGRTARSSRR